MHPLLRRLRARLPYPLSTRAVDGIPHRVHVADSMLPTVDRAGVSSYTQAGRSGLDAIRAGLAMAGKTLGDVATAMDLGCGYGRVLRFLRDHIEPSAITACDLDPRAVAFCAAELGVKPLVSSPDLSRVAFGTYDLVWSGSLLTHLPETACDALLARLPEVLRPDGVAVISFHGEHSLGSLEQLYGGDHAVDAQAIREEVASRGMAYRAYAGRSVGYRQEADYGMAWHRADFLARRAHELGGGDLKLIGHLPRGWDDHHDLAILHRPVGRPSSSENGPAAH